MKFLVGVDEVGRGPLAGPVAVCAFCLKEGLEDSVTLEIFNGKVRDSKKLSAKKRLEIFEKILEMKKRGTADFKVAMAKSQIIDNFGISQSIKKTLEKSILGLNLDPKETKVFLDGGLCAPSIFLSQETIIKGDSKNALIAVASIVAKVHRDKIMFLYSKKFPVYGFEKNMGYGTKSHIESLKKNGPSQIHRKSFLKNIVGGPGGN